MVDDLAPPPTPPPCAPRQDHLIHPPAVKLSRKARKAQRAKEAAAKRDGASDEAQQQQRQSANIIAEAEVLLKQPPNRQKNIPFGRNAVHKADEVKLHVCNLPYSTSHSHLGALFASFGEVLEVFVLKRPDPRNNSRAAFVRMSPVASGEEAMRKLDGTEWHGGSVLRVRLSTHNKDQPHFMNTIGEAPDARVSLDKTKTPKTSSSTSSSESIPGITNENLSSTCTTPTPSPLPLSPSTEFAFPASGKSEDEGDDETSSTSSDDDGPSSHWMLNPNESLYLAAKHAKYQSAQLRASQTTVVATDLFVRILCD